MISTLKKGIGLSVLAALVGLPCLHAQRLCGYELNKASLLARDSSWAHKLASHKASLQQIADHYKHFQNTAAAERTTATISPVPVIFHFVIDSAQYEQIGGTAGIEQRVDSQIAVLNRDYNRANSDSTLIPSGWKHLYASTGIQFGLAHTNPLGFGTPGYEIRIISASGISGIGNIYSDVKHNSTSGLDAWDVTKYMNIWCMNFSDITGLLGVTCYKSETGGTGYPVDEEGVCINYGAIGKRASSLDYYVSAGGGDYYDLGRTLTHEVGHFFEIWHTWGDDGGLCPWNHSGSDDGLADTPPEDDAKYGNLPDTIPGGTYYDGCRFDGLIDTQRTLYGIASHDYMNYVDDIAMHMFTNDQAAAMASMVLVPPSADTGVTGSGLVGENYSLTQNPDLLQWSPRTAVSLLPAAKSLNIYPNPTTGLLSITFDNTADKLQAITVCNILGQQVRNIAAGTQQKDIYTIDLSGYDKGMYIISCKFAGGIVTRKILYQ